MRKIGVYGVFASKPFQNCQCLRRRSEVCDWSEPKQVPHDCVEATAWSLRCVNVEYVTNAFGHTRYVSSDWSLKSEVMITIDIV